MMMMAAPVLPQYRESLTAATHFVDAAFAKGDVHGRPVPGGCRRIAKAPARQYPFSAPGVS